MASNSFSPIAGVDAIGLIWLIINEWYFGYHIIDYSLYSITKEKKKIITDKIILTTNTYSQSPDPDKLKLSNVNKSHRVYCCCCLGKRLEDSILTWNRTIFIRIFLKVFVTASSLLTLIYITLLVLNFLLEYFLVVIINLLLEDTNAGILFLNIICIPMIYYVVKFIFAFTFHHFRLSYSLNADVNGDIKQKHKDILYKDNIKNKGISSNELIATYWRLQIFLCVLICSVLSMLFQDLSLSSYFLLFMTRFMVFSGVVSILSFSGASIFLSILLKIVNWKDIPIYYMFLLCNIDDVKSIKNNNNRKHWALFKIIFMAFCVFAFIICIIIGISTQNNFMVVSGILFLCYYLMCLFVFSKPFHLSALLTNRIPEHHLHDTVPALYKSVLTVSHGSEMNQTNDLYKEDEEQ